MDGRDIFQFSEGGHLQAAGGQCVEVAAGKLVLSDCSNAGAWEATADGQMWPCQPLTSFDPGALQAVGSLGAPLQASATRQRKLTAALRSATVGAGIIDCQVNTQTQEPPTQCVHRQAATVLIVGVEVEGSLQLPALPPSLLFLFA